MSPSLHRFKGRANEPTSQRKHPSIEQALLLELLPKTVLHRVSVLSEEEKEVLVFLVLYGINALLSPKASTSVGKSPWRPWKSSSSKAVMREEVCCPCPFTDALDASIPLAEEGSTMKHSKYKGSLSCDCFSCYARVWARWNASPNCDVINDILYEIENPPLAGKSKRKKKSDKKTGTSKRKDELLHVDITLPNRSLDLVSEGPHHLDAMDTSAHVVDDDASDVRISMENGHVKKEIFAGPMQKEKTTGFSMKPKEKTLVTSMSTDPIIGNSGNAQSGVAPSLDGPETRSGIIAIEIPESLTLGNSSAQGKTHTKLQHHRLGKRRSSQILPVDCEDILVEEEDTPASENMQISMSPRSADAGLGGRGFLARIFPDALGRVASRLWDLVSVRVRSRTVEYH